MKKLCRKTIEFCLRFLKRPPNIKASLTQAKKEAAKLGVTLHVDASEFIDNKHLDCFWYGGHIGLIEYSGWKVLFEVNGDVSLYGEVNGIEVNYMNKNNSGAWGSDICDVIKSDKMLHRELEKMTVAYDNNNWVEWNLIAPDGVFHDMFLIEDNVLEDNVLNAFFDTQYYIDVIERHKASTQAASAKM